MNKRIVVERCEAGTVPTGAWPAHDTMEAEGLFQAAPGKVAVIAHDAGE